MIQDPFALGEDTPPERRRWVSVVVPNPSRGRRLALLVGLVALVATVWIAAAGTGYAYTPAPARAKVPAIDVPQDAAGAKRLHTKLQTQNKALAAALKKMAPTGTYVVVDQTQNRLYIMKDDDIARTSVCSAGSGMVLKDSGGSRKWVFDTPRGVFKVRNKIANPIWKKPDWAFVEEGKPVPKNPADRFESGTLGKYALYLEDGYMIHGTLYTRLLGRSVTHGCIRLGPEDLQAVWDAAPIGTPVFIF
ncbi:MAG TPA: L,D-transpeptidase [Candidatus Polarisedimenticolaceae bacterium]|nr:L,D-transpeptidase [Candidatus Polarisedimenticolaceae bacterium]